MAVSKNLKEKLLNAIEVLNALKGLNSKDDGLSSDLPSAPKSGEYNTISYKLGKILLDSKKDIPSALGTPKKLCELYFESNRRKVNKNAKNHSFDKSLKKRNESSRKELSYKNIEDFLELSIDISSSSFQDFREAFGVYPGERIHILNQKKVFFDSDEGVPIYTKSKKLYKINSEIRQGVNLKFDFEVSKHVEVVVIVSFFNIDSKERLSYNMLPINKSINIYVPEGSEYFSLGLKVLGQGLVKYKDTTFNNIKSRVKNLPINIDSALHEGISIVIPSYKGEVTLFDTLESIVNQKGIDFSLLEVVIVINGERDKTEEKLIKFAAEKDFLTINYSYSSIAGASRARNIAIQKATKTFIVFCDDDDMLSEEFLAGLYQVRSLDSIGFCQIYDLKNDGQLLKDNPINQRLLSALDAEKPSLDNFTSALTMIACKILPTENLRRIKFNEELKSGEDVSFFSEYYIKFEPKLVMSSNKNTYYIRRLVSNSISRQAVSFDFNVLQRLDVISDLILLKKKLTKAQLEFVDTKIRAQCGFIVKYLKDNPADYQKVHLSIIQKGIDLFPYRYLQDRLEMVSPDLLIISYCHPPFVDTSAVVASKRAFEFNELCDVICADMSSIRGINSDLPKINKHLVRDSFVLSTIPSFGDWKGISDFCESTISITQNRKYGKVYSRSFWPASHFAAFEYKRKNPNVKWIAEFSDPVVFDIEGKVRDSLISKEWIREVVNGFHLEANLMNEENLYVWCELIVYLCADEIIFTCDNQKELMLSQFPYPKSILNSKGLVNIVPHPTLPSEYYESKISNYKINDKNLNFAYFGAFYKTRRLDDLIVVLHFYKNNKIKFKGCKDPLVHIFTEQIDSAKSMIEKEGLESYFIINPYMDYFEFLNISRNMDVLIVNDAKANEVFNINPYLPSKLSDYLNSGSEIWAFYEERSTLSLAEGISYKSKLGDVDNAVQTFFNILNKG